MLRIRVTNLKCERHPRYSGRASADASCVLPATTACVTRELKDGDCLFKEGSYLPDAGIDATLLAVSELQGSVRFGRRYASPITNGYLSAKEDSEFVQTRGPGRVSPEGASEE
jgi:hypothetical protein